MRFRLLGASLLSVGLLTPASSWAEPQAGSTSGTPSAAQKKPGRRAKAKPRPDAPVASYPGFRMLADGRSRVFVSVSRKVEVTEHKAEGRIVYRLKGARLAQKNNQLPLLTGYFATPVGRVHLAPQGEDIDLVIELRQPSPVEHRLVDFRDEIVLQVDFPAVARRDPESAPGAPPGGKRPTGATQIRDDGAR